MKSGIFRLGLAAIAASLLTMASWGCSSQSPISPEDTESVSSTAKERASQDVDFVGRIISIDLDSRVVMFNERPEKFAVAQNVVIVGKGASSVGSRLTIKDLKLGDYVRAEGRFMDRETVVLGRLTLIAPERFATSYERGGTI